MRLAIAAVVLFALVFLAQMPSAKTTVGSRGCKVIFTVYIALVGNGTSEEFAQRVRDGIEIYWNNGFTFYWILFTSRILFAYSVVLNSSFYKTMAPRYPNAKRQRTKVVFFKKEVRG